MIVMVRDLKRVRYRRWRAGLHRLLWFWAAALAVASIAVITLGGW